MSENTGFFSRIAKLPEKFTAFIKETANNPKTEVISHNLAGLTKTDTYSKSKYTSSGDVQKAGFNRGQPSKSGQTTTNTDKQTLSKMEQSVIKWFRNNPTNVFAQSFFKLTEYLSNQTSSTIRNSTKYGKLQKIEHALRDYMYSSLIHVKNIAQSTNQEKYFEHLYKESLDLNFHGQASWDKFKTVLQKKELWDTFKNILLSEIRIPTALEMTKTELKTSKQVLERLKKQKAKLEINTKHVELLEEQLTKFNNKTLSTDDLLKKYPKLIKNADNLKEDELKQAIQTALTEKINKAKTPPNPQLIEALDKKIKKIRSHRVVLQAEGRVLSKSLPIRSHIGNLAKKISNKVFKTEYNIKTVNKDARTVAKKSLDTKITKFKSKGSKKFNFVYKLLSKSKRLLARTILKPLTRCLGSALAATMYLGDKIPVVNKFINTKAPLLHKLLGFFDTNMSLAVKSNSIRNIGIEMTRSSVGIGIGAVIFGLVALTPVMPFIAGAIGLGSIGAFATPLIIGLISAILGDSVADKFFNLFRSSTMKTAITEHKMPVNPNTSLDRGEGKAMLQKLDDILKIPPESQKQPAMPKI